MQNVVIPKILAWLICYSWQVFEPKIIPSIKLSKTSYPNLSISGSSLGKLMLKDRSRKKPLDLAAMKLILMRVVWGVGGAQVWQKPDYRMGTSTNNRLKKLYSQWEWCCMRESCRQGAWFKKMRETWIYLNADEQESAEKEIENNRKGTDELKSQRKQERINFKL